MKKINSFAFLLALTAFSSSSITLAQYRENKEPTQAEKDSSFHLSGPSFHLGLGVRSQKEPNEDTYGSTVAGLKISLMNMHFGSQMYLSLISGGINYVGRERRMAFSVSPVLINHTSGVGLGFDIYDVRPDRSGGPFGLSLNVDPFRLSAFIDSVTR